LVNKNLRVIDVFVILSDREKRSKERIDYKKLNDGSYDVGVDEVKVAPFVLKGCQGGVEDLAVFSEEGERSLDSYDEEVECKASAGVKFDKESMYFSFFFSI